MVKALAKALGNAIAVPAVPAGWLYGLMAAYRLYHPARRAHHKRPGDVGLTATDIQIPIARGKRLHAWVCRGAADHVVVLGHGLGLGKSASLAQARLLHDAGFTVCLFDHRNHGRSSTDRAWTGLSDRFTDDIVSVVAHLRGSEGYENARITVFGFSFSTFASLYSLDCRNSGIDAVICDSGPAADIGPIFARLFDAGVLPLPSVFRAAPLRVAVTASLRSVGLVMLKARWPPPATSGQQVPMLFLTGDQDEVIPSAEVARFAGRYHRAEVREFAHAAHLGGLKADPAGYKKEVTEFLYSVAAADRPMRSSAV